MPFTPVHSLVGAAMMGMAASSLLTLNGRVLGISGFAHRSVSSLRYHTRKQMNHFGSDKPADDADPDPEHLALLSMGGLLVGGLVLALGLTRLEDSLQVKLFDVHTPNEVDWVQYVTYGLAGLLVGIGSRLSNGCTSGHMLCGVSRLSPRSLLATGIFVPVAVVTHLIFLRYLKSSSFESAHEREPGTPSWIAVLLLQTPVLIYRYGAAFIKGFLGESYARRLVAFSASLHFALGLALSGMLRPSKILGFMNMTPSAIHDGQWDPSLLMIIVGGIIPQVLLWQCCLGQYIRNSGNWPTFANDWYIPETPTHWREGITPRLVIGAALFGIGWGICGMCPGPAAVLIGAVAGGNARLDVWSQVLVWIGGFFIGGTVAAGLF